MNELRDIKKIETEYGKTKFPNHQYLELSFEDLIQNKDAQMSRVFSFLELEHEKIENVKGNLKRQNPEKLENLVINYKELKEAILNSEFATLI